MISPEHCKIKPQDFSVSYVFLFSIRSKSDFTIAYNRGQPDVDFKAVDSHVHQLKGSSSRY